MNLQADGIQGYAVGCPELVTLVEQGEIDGLAVEESVKQALHPIIKEDVDVIVLGCTHFPRYGLLLNVLPITRYTSLIVAQRLLAAHIMCWTLRD